MLYTRKGDDGTTKAFDSKPGQRISKGSCRTEALGTLDELNSFIGLVKVKSVDIALLVKMNDTDMKLIEVVHWIQECLFVIQAEVAGADKHVDSSKIIGLESMVDWAEKEMPPIKTFFISGGIELAVLMDISRTLARRAERHVIIGFEKAEFTVSSDTLAFLNRLSSLFYALARLINHKSGIKEQSPSYG